MPRLAPLTVLVFSLAAYPLAAAPTDAQIKELFRQQKYAECLAAIDVRRDKEPANTLLLSTSGDCKFKLGDAQGARTDFTLTLIQIPLKADFWVGRAECELAMGAVRDGEEDYAIARQIDAKAVEPFEPEYRALLKAAKDIAEKEPIDALWQKFVSSGPEVPEKELNALAIRVTRARNAERHLSDEDFTRADVRFALAVRVRPDDVTALLDEADFLLDPNVSRPATFSGRAYSAKIPVHDAEPARAQPLLERAVKLDPANGRAKALMAQLCVDLGRHADAIAWADQALAAGNDTVDVCRIHMISRTNAAGPLDERARQLRNPPPRFVDRVENGVRVQRTMQDPPSPAALAEADRLTAQSDALRRDAAAPMQRLIARTQNATTSADQITCALANLYFSEWRAKYDDAIAWAKKAVDLDPFQPEALLMLVNLGTSMHYEDLAHQARARLNMAVNRSAGATVDSVWPLMLKRQFDQARQAIERGDREDPGAIELVDARFALAQEQADLKGAERAARLVNAVNFARVSLAGRKFAPTPPSAPLGEDVVLPAYTAVTLGLMLADAGRSGEALDKFQSAITLASRVPQRQLSTQVPDAAVPNDRLNAPAGTYLGAVLADARRLAAEIHAHGNVSNPTASPMYLQLQIDQINRQLNQGVGPDDERALLAKRAALTAQLNQQRR